jgi:hypothetical protein
LWPVTSSYAPTGFSPVQFDPKRGTQTYFLKPTR